MLSLEIIVVPLMLKRRVESKLAGSIVMTLLAVALTLLEALIELAQVATSAALSVEPLSKVQRAQSSAVECEIAVRYKCYRRARSIRLLRDTERQE